MADTPCGRDITIRKVQSSALYILSRADGPLQFFYRNYDEALTTAAAFAQRERLDAWYTADHGNTFARIATYRLTEAAATV